MLLNGYLLLIVGLVSCDGVPSDYFVWESNTDDICYELFWHDLVNVDFLVKCNENEVTVDNLLFDQQERHYHLSNTSSTIYAYRLFAEEVRTSCLVNFDSESMTQFVYDGQHTMLGLMNGHWKVFTGGSGCLN